MIVFGVRVEDTENRLKWIAVIHCRNPWKVTSQKEKKKIVICSESRQQLEENLERWRFALERSGMKVSRSKTEYMCVNESETSGILRQKFKYLQTTVQSSGDCG